MSYIGFWKFHSIGTVNDDCEMVYLNEEEYLNSPMPYIDTEDPDAVADEMRERKQMIGSQIEICEDGKLYMLMPLPEDVPQEEVDEAVAAGVITLMDGMMTDKPAAWEERDGELWYDTGIKGEVFGEKADGWVKAIDENGYFTFATTRFVKVD